MNNNLWLRSETKQGEERRALVPDDAERLVKAGFQVTVEKSAQSIFSHTDYSDRGCRLAEEGDWREAGPETFILGLKELPQGDYPLVHRHIYFAHAYKGQAGWQKLLQRFTEGGGALYDLEYLTGDDGKRVAAFGYWAGFAGMALALTAWTQYSDEQFPYLKDLNSWPAKDDWIKSLEPELEKNKPKVIVIGAKGRCGTGARHAAAALGVEVTEWDLEETARGGPFPEINRHNIFVNCVFVHEKVPPFLTWDSLDEHNRKLRLICDVSCDPTSGSNPLPIYQTCTDLISPVNRIIPGKAALDLIAIDHLPSLLPSESSIDFSGQLLPHMLKLRDSEPVWKRAREIFMEKSGRSK